MRSEIALRSQSPLALVGKSGASRKFSGNVIPRNQGRGVRLQMTIGEPFDRAGAYNLVLALSPEDISALVKLLLPESDLADALDARLRRRDVANSTLWVGQEPHDLDEAGED